MQSKEKFLQKITENDSYYSIMNRAEYDAKLHRLIEIESDHSIKKTPADYKLRGKFDILSVDVEGTIVKKLVKKGTQLRYVCKEDLYETIHRAHRDKGHSGRVIMYKHLSANFANVTQEQISDYLAFCESCQKKKSAMRKSIVVKPIISSHMNSRGQVDLIDMQSDPDRDFGASVTCHHCSKEAETNSQQEAAKENQMAQADRMLQRSARQLAPLKVGSSVMVPIPEVDRGRAEFPNVKGIVMEVTSEGMHKIGTEHGVLNNLYAANCVTPCREAFLSVENVPDKTVSLRTAANSSAMGSGQGTFKCGCKQKCNSTRCKCFKSKLKCNSKCHSSMPCDNKHE